MLAPSSKFRLLSKILLFCSRSGSCLVFLVFIFFLFFFGGGRLVLFCFPFPSLLLPAEGTTYKELPLPYGKWNYTLLAWLVYASLISLLSQMYRSFSFMVSEWALGFKLSPPHEYKTLCFQVEWKLDSCPTCSFF